jgi:hypothetical protein
MTPTAGSDLSSDIARMEATLNRMLRAAGRRSVAATQSGDLRADQGWNWLDGETPAAGGVEVTEHALPEGIDFFTFQTLVGELH